MREPYNPKPEHDLSAGLRKTFPIRYAEVGANKNGLEEFPILHVDGQAQTPPDRVVITLAGVCVCGLLLAVVVIFS